MKYSLSILRITLGIIFITHGLARLYYSSVYDFGNFLESKNIPLGIAVAWIITLGEIASGVLLAWGKFIKYCCTFHGMVIIIGIFLVHLPNGWFVAGHGKGGVEYSLLILAVLLYLFQQDSKTKIPISNL